MSKLRKGSIVKVNNNYFKKDTICKILEIDICGSYEDIWVEPKDRADILPAWTHIIHNEFCSSREDMVKV